MWTIAKNIIDIRCPCGSGKLYLECCGMKKKVVSLEQARWRRTGRDLRRKLGEFAEEPEFIVEAGHAQDLYFSSLDEDFVDDDFTMERCFEWFIFDYLMTDRLTLVEAYYELPDLDYYEKKLLSKWVNAKISLYEVLKVFPKNSLIIQDIITGHQFHVRDASVASEIELGNILLMRVLKVGSEYEFSTSGLALPAAAKPFLIVKIHEDMHELFEKRKSEGLLDWNKYLQARSHMINGWVVDIGLYSGLPDIYGHNAVKESPFNVVNLSKHDIDCLISDIKQFISFNPVEKTVPVINSSTHQENKQYGKLIGKKTIKKGGSVLRLDVEAVFNWAKPIYAEVAKKLVDVLHKQGHDLSQQEGAVRMWYDFCGKGKPAFRKAPTWTATLVYAVARLGLDKDVHQSKLAKEYGVASSTISNNFRALCRVLDLVAFDHRYFTQESPLTELKEVDPLLAEILENLRL